jgi:hypothetical protein
MASPESLERISIDIRNDVDGVFVCWRRDFETKSEKQALPEYTDLIVCKVRYLEPANNVTALFEHLFRNAFAISFGHLTFRNNGRVRYLKIFAGGKE